MKLFILFCVLNVLNVVTQTIKSLATVKCGKTAAALVNAFAYGLYTIVLVYTMCDLPLFTKALVVALANLIGVYIVKLFEEKARKDKLWKIELTVKPENAVNLENAFKGCNIPHNYINIEKYVIFNAFCETQKQSAFVKEIAKRNGAKCFASETKIL